MDEKGMNVYPDKPRGIKTHELIRNSLILNE